MRGFLTSAELFAFVPTAVDATSPRQRGRVRFTTADLAARREEAARLYESGLTLTEVAEQVGFSRHAVARDLQALGIPRRARGRRLSPAVARRRDRVVDLYVNGGLSSGQIAALLRVPTALVCKDLTRRGIR